MSDNVKVKICGLYREMDIDYVNQYKPDYIGFIFWDKSHRYVSDEQARLLKSRLDSGITAVGVFVDDDNEHIIKLLQDGIIDVAQLHGNETDEDIVYIKSKTKAQIIKAVKIKTGDEPLMWQKSSADFILMDSGMGTGKTFDWSMIKGDGDYKQLKPIFLAGGLNSENIAEAIRKFNPYAVDLSSSVETDKKKDPEKIRRVIEAVREI